MKQVTDVGITQVKCNKLLPVNTWCESCGESRVVGVSKALTSALQALK